MISWPIGTKRANDTKRASRYQFRRQIDRRTRYIRAMWNSEWNAISSRIAGIVEASSFLFKNSLNDRRHHGRSPKVLTDNCDKTAESVFGLRSYGNALPAEAGKALERFEGDWRTASDSGPLSQPFSEFALLESKVVLLASIRSELGHLLADRNVIIRSLVKRAFHHLDYSLVADQEIRDKWLAAFNTHETACEKLGAVHLLLHGIWAFKSNAEGGRTDLVLGNRLEVSDEVIGAARGLVLTEWKLIKKQGKTPADVMNGAKFQAKRYAEGVLAGFELQFERYLILVGEEEFEVPKDTIDGLVTYKVIPIVLNRKTPSLAAKKQSKKARS